MQEVENVTKKEKTGKVYLITNPVQAKYIGSTNQPINNRWCPYKNLKCVEQPKLLRSLVKYGPENHTFEVIWEGLADDRLKWERTLGEELKVLDPKLGLNLSLPGYGDIPFIHSEETKKKMSDSRKGSKHHNYGKKASPELIAKFSKAHSGSNNHRFGKRGIANSTSVKINQFNLEGNYIKTFNCYSEIESVIEDICRDGLKRVLDKCYYTYKNYLWCYYVGSVEDLQIDKLPIKINKLDNSGNVLETFDSIEIAGRQHHKNEYEGVKWIRGCINGLQTKAFKFKWEYQCSEFNNKKGRKRPTPHSLESIKKRAEKCKKPVDMFTKSWVYIESFTSTKEASEKMGGNRGEIGKSCKDGKTTVKGFRFKWRSTDV